MKTIQDYIQDAENKVQIGIKAEKDYCVNKNHTQSRGYKAYADASFKSAKTAVKKAYAFAGLELPKKATTIFLLDMYLRVLHAQFAVFTCEAEAAVRNV